MLLITQHRDEGSKEILLMLLFEDGKKTEAHS